MGNIHVKLSEIWTKVQEMSFKEKVYGQSQDGQRIITKVHLVPLAQVS